MNRTLYKVALCVVIVITVYFTWFGTHIHAQFTGNLQWDSGFAGLSVPFGGVYRQYRLNPLEHLWVSLFYLGEEIDVSAIPPDVPSDPAYEARDGYHYYKMRGRETLSTIIIEGPYACVGRLSEIGGYCSGEKLPRNEVFEVILRKFYCCTEASDIIAVRIEKPVLNKENEVIQRITDSDQILAIWDILCKADYRCSSSDCTVPAPASVNDLANATLTVIKQSLHAIVLEFPDGSEFVFSTYFPKEGLLLFGTANEMLYLNEDDALQLREVLEIPA